MSQYILIILWLIALYVTSFFVNIYTTENILGKKELRVNKKGSVK